MSFRPSHLVVHTLAYKGAADVDTVRRWHLEKGWSDIGYHYLIRRDGEVQKGRPDTVKGAHARDGGYNHKSLGIACEGHGDFEPFTLNQVASLIGLTKALRREHNIPVENVIGHRETGALKTCPGKLVDMEALRKILTEAEK